MGIFSRIFGGHDGTRADPVLGRLTRRGDEWSGQGHWADGGPPFALTVYRQAGPPDEADRALFLQLGRDYPALRPDLQACLADLWRAHRASAETEAPDFANALALWQCLSLQGVGLHADGHAQLVFGFVAEAHPAGAFLIAVRGRQVEPVEYVA